MSIYLSLDHMLHLQQKTQLIIKLDSLSIVELLQNGQRATATPPHAGKEMRRWKNQYRKG